MSTRVVRSLALLVAGGLAAVTVPPAPTAQAIIPLKNAAIIDRTAKGYRYQAGQQDSHLTVTLRKGHLRFTDSGTKELRALPGSCRRVRVRVGIAAVCNVPRGVSSRRPLLLEIWPRLGDDFVDASTLPAGFNLSVLADAGRDVVRGGAGNDFVNGAQDADRARGGAGNDWIRTGLGRDHISGGRGNDRLVGVEGADTVRGGAGNDRVGGGPGNDRLVAGDGRDVVSCGTGRDDALLSGRDRSSSCERVVRR